jgi:hypothetical protein
MNTKTANQAERAFRLPLSCPGGRGWGKVEAKVEVEEPKTTQEAFAAFPQQLTICTFQF